MSILSNRTTVLTIFGITDINNHEAVKVELEKGIDVNVTDSGGRTLLMEAAIKRDHELVALLIANNADVNISDERRWTALHFAAQEYDIETTKLLVDAGAEVNALDDYGNSVISKAVLNSKGRGDVITFLIANGADVNLHNHSGISALDLARKISNYNVLQYLT